MSDKFDWDSSSNIVVQRVDPIAIYRNPQGGLVIRVQDIDLGDTWVVIPVHAAKTVADAIMRIATQEWEPDPSEA